MCVCACVCLNYLLLCTTKLCKVLKNIPIKNELLDVNLDSRHSIVSGPGCSSATKDMFEDSPVASTSTVAVEQLDSRKVHCPRWSKAAINSERNLQMILLNSSATTHWQVMFCKGHTS